MDATTSYSTISAGVHAFIVPWALYMESQPKARIDDGTIYPLDSTEFFAKDTGQSDSGGVRGGISWSVLSVGL